MKELERQAWLAIPAARHIRWQPVRVTGQTRNRYRIRAVCRVQLSRRKYLEPGCVALVPKSAVTFNPPQQ